MNKAGCVLFDELFEGNTLGLEGLRKVTRTWSELVDHHRLEVLLIGDKHFGQCLGLVLDLLDLGEVKRLAGCQSCRDVLHFGEDVLMSHGPHFGYRFQTEVEMPHHPQARVEKHLDKAKIVHGQFHCGWMVCLLMQLRRLVN
uniref:Uncharacterized protein n=1 Tax=Opuntia streptacantha TaxID=393608 RepID=A0A7C9AHH1_OPUST